MNIRNALILPLLFMLGIGCENVFEPLKMNENTHFSMYGAFDLNAETQWVRVMPVMDSLVWRTPKPIDAQVRLIRTSNGEESVLNDSLFIFQKGYYAWNFWTTTQMVEGEEYMLIAEDSEGNSSSATFQMPMDFPDPVVEYSYFTESGIVHGTGVDTLVVADGIYDIIINRGGYVQTRYGVRISHLEKISYSENGDYEFRINDLGALADKFSVKNTEIGILDRQLEIATGSEGWPDVAGMVQEEIILPNINSNVKDGLGVVVGIVRKRIQL